MKDISILYERQNGTWSCRIQYGDQKGSYRFLKGESLNDAIQALIGDEQKTNLAELEALITRVLPPWNSLERVWNNRSQDPWLHTP